MYIGPLRLTWVFGVFVLVLGFLGLAGIYRLTHDTSTTNYQQQAFDARSQYYVPGLVLDLQAPVRPVVEGSFTYNGPGGPFVQRFRGVFDFEAGCESYIKGSSGRFQTPYALYLKGTKLQRSLTGRVTVAAYKGPGPYTSAQMEGDLGARDGNGAMLGTTSSGARGTFLLQTRSDGSGSVTFTGPDVSNGREQTISGVLNWTCEDARIDLSAYTLTPY
jgi:hypothetical protein